MAKFGVIDPEFGAITLKYGVLFTPKPRTFGVISLHIFAKNRAYFGVIWSKTAEKIDTLTLKLTGKLTALAPVLWALYSMPLFVNHVFNFFYIYSLKKISNIYTI